MLGISGYFPVDGVVTGIVAPKIRGHRELTRPPDAQIPVGFLVLPRRVLVLP